MENYNNILEACFLFRDIDGIPPDLADSLEIMRCSAGENIFPAEKQGRYMGIVASGKAEVLKHSGQVVMSILIPGNEFGAASLYSGYDYFVTDIIAAADMDVIYIPKAAIDSLMQSNVDIARNYIAYLSERIYFLNGRIDGFTSGSIERSLSIYIADNMDANGELVLPCSLSRLADVLHVGRASLYRAMDELEEKGIIKRNKRYIRVVDKSSLR